MKRLAIAVSILAIGAAGCGSKSPGAPSTTTIFTVQLSALSENPPIANAEATARGTAVITIDSAKNTVDFNVSVNSFPAGSTITAAHIHNAPAGQNAGVFLSAGLASGTVTLTNGSGTVSLLQLPATPAQIASILAAPQNFYFNMHSTLNGGGVIRGQLR